MNVSEMYQILIPYVPTFIPTKPNYFNKKNYHGMDL